MCEGVVSVFQGVEEESLQFCPSCGLGVRKIISRASFTMRTGPNHDKAGQRGFTTWKKSGAGVWEKVAGPGVDVIAGTPEQVAEVKAEDKPKKILELGD
jgi:hypothetical protein